MKYSLLLLSSASAIKFRPPAGSNPWHKDVSEGTWFKPDWDINYFVPDFGVDPEIIATQEHTKLAEAKLNVTWTP